jgi:ATP-binding cassette subfamily A (ABC1) protein 3
VASIDILEKNETIPLLINQITNDSQIIYFSSTINNTNEIILNEIFSKYSSEDNSKFEFEHIDFDIKENITEDDVAFMQKIYDKKNENNIKNNYIGYLFTDINNETNQYEFSYFPDIISRQSTAIYLNYLLKNIVRYATKNEKLEFEIINEPLPYTYEEKNDKQERYKMVIVFFISISFSLIPANFITIIIKERENNSKHLQIISGISLFSYWFNNYLFELIKYYVVGGICILILYIYNYYKKYLLILYLEYGPAMVSFTYLFNFIFNSEDKAQTFVLLINLLLGTLGGFAVLIMKFNYELLNKAKILSYILRIVPSFCFSYGYNVILNEESLENNGYSFDIYEFEYIKSDFIYLGIESIFYLLILTFFENSKIIFMSCYTNQKKNININNIEINNNDNNCSIPENVNDSYVKKEIKKAKDPNNKDNYAIKIINLIKTFYGGPFGFKIFNCCFKSTKAVRDISFCLEYGECFGFLGINGAGKTTTFKCLSNEIIPTSGNIFIDNKNINKDFENIRSLIGYCPQFDAIFDFLTVYENLEFYGTIKGAKKEKLKEIINALIEEMNLLVFKNKIAGTLSGGNKRKLSVAIALICNPPIILLDEPSTGMDPEARRFMWGVIHRVSINQKKSTIIMTTHSMEEAETLCKRIGILVDGQFKCLSTSDEIKEKYGYGYEINLQIIKPDTNKLYEIFNVCDDDKNKEISYNCLEKDLILYKLHKYYNLIQKDKFGGKILEEFEIYGKMNFNKILIWIYYLNNFFGIVSIILDFFPEVFCVDYSDNNYIISIKKEVDKSIGFLFGLIEDNKEKYNIEQYDLKLTSLEQIFNKFAREKEKKSDEIINNGNNIIKIDKELIDSYS